MGKNYIQVPLQYTWHRLVAHQCTAEYWLQSIGIEHEVRYIKTYLFICLSVISRRTGSGVSIDSLDQVLEPQSSSESDGEDNTKEARVVCAKSESSPKRTTSVSIAIFLRLICRRKY